MSSPHPGPLRHPRSVALLAGALLLSACRAPQGEESWAPTAGLRTTVYDNFDFDINSIIFAESGSIDYSMTELTLGATLVSPGKRRPIKKQFLGARIGDGTLKKDGISSNLVETSLGGIWYLDDGDLVVPFVSLFGVLSNTSRVPDLGNQTGIRLGTGIEIPIRYGLSASLGIDYLVPVFDAKTSSGIAEATLEGVAVRVGVLMTF